MGKLPKPSSGAVLEEPRNLPARCFRAHPPSPMSPRVRPPAGTLAPSSSMTPSPSLSDLADVDASQPLVFPELPTNSTPSRLGARSESQRGPAVAQASGPPFSTARSSGRASNATARSPASAWSSSSLPPQRRRMVHRHAPRSCPNHLAATAPSVYLHTTDQELTQSPQSRDYTQLVHSTCWQSLITPRSRPPLPLTSPLKEPVLPPWPLASASSSTKTPRPHLRHHLATPPRRVPSWPPPTSPPSRSPLPASLPPCPEFGCTAAGRSSPRALVLGSASEQPYVRFTTTPPHP